ncbi:MAG: hypothetical protein WC136_01885 [Sphaerochaeta sp.]
MQTYESTHYLKDRICVQEVCTDEIELGAYLVVEAIAEEKGLIN